MLAVVLREYKLCHCVYFHSNWTVMFVFCSGRLVFVLHQSTQLYLLYRSTRCQCGTVKLVLSEKPAAVPLSQAARAVAAEGAFSLHTMPTSTLTIHCNHSFTLQFCAIYSFDIVKYLISLISNYLIILSHYLTCPWHSYVDTNKWSLFTWSKKFLQNSIY